MKQATHFIEHYKIEYGAVPCSSPIPVRLFDWSQTVNKRHQIEVIAIFKIYPK